MIVKALFIALLFTSCGVYVGFVTQRFTGIVDKGKSVSFTLVKTSAIKIGHGGAIAGICMDLWARTDYVFTFINLLLVLGTFVLIVMYQIDQYRDS